jgi:CheY-like chemotaxis protein
MQLSEIDILLVEYDPTDLGMTLRALRANHVNINNRVHVACDGEEALDFLFCRGPFQKRSFDHPPKVVLLDLKLPSVDGMEVLRRLKADVRTRSIPVVILTDATCFALGAAHFLESSAKENPACTPAK